MAEYTGRKVSYGIAKEASRGTAETSVDFWLPHLALSLIPKRTKVMNESSVGSLAEYNDSDTFESYSEASFEGKVEAESFPLLLLNAMGSLSTAANADGSGNVYDHTVTVSNDNSSQSLTLFQKDGAGTFAYPLAMISTLDLTAELGDFIKYSGSAIAGDEEDSVVVPAYTTAIEFKPKYMSVKLAANTAGLSGASAITSIQSLRLTVDRTIERDHQFGSEVPYDVSVRAVQVNGELVLRHTDDTYKDNFLADDKQAMEISIVNTDETIGTAANPGFVFTLPKVTFEDWSKDDTLNDKVNQTIGFQGLLDVATGEILSVVATNLTASY